jgi:hypothetical protein
MSGIPIAFAGLDLSIASQAVSLRFLDLSNSYPTSNSIESSQFFFFRSPEFDPALLNLAEATKQTLAMGEFLTIATPKVSANFTGPIDVVNGENDLPNCAGNCLLPYNKAAAVKAVLFPNASNGSSWYITPLNRKCVEYALHGRCGICACPQVPRDEWALNRRNMIFNGTLEW